MIAARILLEGFGMSSVGIFIYLVITVVSLNFFNKRLIRGGIV